MFTIEKRIAKNGKPYIGLFPNGGKKPVVVNNYSVLAPIIGCTFAELAEIRNTDGMTLDMCFREFDE